MRTLRRVALLHLTSFALLLLPSFSFAAQGEEGTAPAQTLAKRISEKLRGATAVVLSIQNLSSLPAGDFGRARGDLEMELRKQGLRLGANEPEAAQINLTLAETARGYLWVAEILRGDERDVLMQPFERPKPSAHASSTPLMVLRSQVLLERDEPMLDFAPFSLPGDARPRLLVLEPARVLSFVFDDGRWQPHEAKPLTLAIVRSRDPRGRLLLSHSSLTISLPGLHCTGTAGESLALECAEGDEPWEFRLSESEGFRAGLVRGRNFFDWQTSNVQNYARRTPPFFSVAGIQLSQQPAWIAAGIDGRARLYETDSGAQATAAFDGWGSDLSGVATDCGTGWQVLATRAGDASEPEAVQAFEIVEQQAVAVSAPLELPGPLVSLRPSESGGAAHAVVRNLKTGRYEARTLSLSCGR